MSEIPVGLELDRAVAKRVMGTEIRSAVFTRDYGDGEYTVWTPVPKYSTDIAAAWQVVKKMIANGWNAHVSFTDRVRQSPAWYAGFWKQGASEAWWRECETASEAISRAALAAMKVD